MSVTGIGGVSAYNQYNAQAKEAAAKSGSSEVQTILDRYESSSSLASAILGTGSVSSSDKASRFTDLVSGLLGKQAQGYGMSNGSAGQLTSSYLNINISIEFDESDFSGLGGVSGMTQSEAQEAIGEKGYWGVNAVSTRIMDMAVALAGGDSEKMTQMQDAVNAGFEKAKGLFGGELPQISYDTKSEIENRFAYWFENGSLDGYVSPEKQSASAEA